MTISKFVLLVFTINIIAACHSNQATKTVENVNKPDTVITESKSLLPGIEGRWELFETSGGFSGRGRPVMVGKEFLTFMPKGKYNSSCTDMGKGGDYTLSKEEVWGKEAVVISFDSSRMDFIVNMKANDTLSLIFVGNDGFNYLFTRR